MNSLNNWLINSERPHKKMKYSYVGVNRSREKVKGTIDAANEQEAVVRLRSLQIRAEKVSKQSQGISIDFNFGAPINLKGLIVFTRQFSSLIDSGIAIMQCIDILQEQEKRKAFKKILLQVKEDIEAGSGLGEALAKHPKVFSKFYVSIVEAGELSGTLDKSLKRISLQLEKLGRLRAKVIGALTYPAITMFVAICAVVILLIKVIPEIAKLYGNKPLPPMTVLVLELSQFVQDYWVLLFGGGIAAAVGFSFLMKLPAFRMAFDPIWIRIPIFGSLTLKSSVARFSRTLSTLIASGVPLLSGFDICEKILTNYAVCDSIRRAHSAVTEGKGIASGLAEKKVFPAMVVHMVNIGEMTGRLDELLTKVADIYDDEVDDAVSAMTDVLQPMLIVGIGVIVLFLMIAMYLPIFSIGEAASGL
jgi:type IV pilus assembly protein PilC